MSAARLTGDGLCWRINDRHLLDDVDIEVGAGELIGVLGPNGAGKSSLLRVLAGLDRPDAGRVELDGLPIARLGARERARRIGWLEQLAPLHWSFSVERLVTLGRLPWLPGWQRPSAADLACVEAALGLTDCESLRARRVRNLSGGERARVLLARVLAGEPDILLADEPTATLDLAHQLQTLESLRAICDAGRACAVVLHELPLAMRFCDRVYLMHRGRIHSHGRPDAVLDDAAFADVYGVRVRRGGGSLPWLVPLERIDRGRS